MKKKFALTEIDCANCAAKIEDAVSKIDGVNEVSINFMAQKITIDAEDDKFEDVLEQAQKAITKIEPGCEIVRK